MVKIIIDYTKELRASTAAVKQHGRSSTNELAVLWAKVNDIGASQKCLPPKYLHKHGIGILRGKVEYNEKLRFNADCKR